MSIFDAFWFRMSARECAFVHLTRRIARQICNDINFSGHFESSKVGTAVGKKLARRKGMSGNDISHWLLLVVCQCAPNNCSFGDPFMSLKHSFYFARKDFRAASKNYF